MRLLITGGSGFVGWNAVRYFVERGIDVVATYRSLPHYLQRAADCPAVALELGDPQAIERVVARFQPSIILHAAAVARPQHAGDPSELIAINVQATARLAEAAARHNAGLVYLSTDLVYSDAAGICNESTPAAPSGAGGYSRTKFDAEELVRSSPARSIILRPTLMFGDGPPRSNSFSMFIDRHWSSGQPAPLFTDQYRSFLYVEDLCSAVETVAFAHRSWGEMFVCGGPEAMSRAEFGVRYADAFGVDRALITPMKSTELDGYRGGPSRIVIDSAKLRSLGWTPRTIEAAVQTMVSRRNMTNDQGGIDKQE